MYIGWTRILILNGISIFLSLAVRFDIGVNIGGSFFYDIPRTVTDAVSEGWTLKDQPSDLPVTSVDMYCYSDLIVCTFYDANGDVAGMQVAVSIKNVLNSFKLCRGGLM